ncbi:putative ubiquitin-like protein [Xylogone sp. PMI_703]|nr:putative ubiquitin-like protein [Xylogone sp. PMI_703]
MADSSSSHQRSRSRSPSGRGHGGGGFRWKKKPTSRYDDDRDDNSNRRYRQRSRSPRRDYSRTDRYDSRRPPRLDYDRERERDDRSYAPNKPSNKETSDKDKQDDTKDKKKDEAPKKKMMAPSEPLLIVHINNRLGSKTSVPCLASDKIGQLKALVAAQIGQPPSSIVLRRQGERPFKDQLTLEDYGISSGVQLDLEIDTGD